MELNFIHRYAAIPAGDLIFGEMRPLLLEPYLGAIPVPLEDSALALRAHPGMKAAYNPEFHNFICFGKSLLYVTLYQCITDALVPVVRVCIAFREGQRRIRLGGFLHIEIERPFLPVDIDQG